MATCAYLGAEGGLNGIGERINTAQHERAGLAAEFDLLSGDAGVEPLRGGRTGAAAHSGAGVGSSSAEHYDVWILMWRDVRVCLCVIRVLAIKKEAARRHADRHTTHAFLERSHRSVFRIFSNFRLRSLHFRKLALEHTA